MGNMELLEKIDFAKYDPEGMIKHIENFPELCLSAFKVSKECGLPSYYIKAKKIVMLGMGGSGEAGDIVKGLMAESGLIVDSIHNYEVPGYVDKDTLVIANSYSGNTEETLAGFISAYQKGAKLIAITTGGKLKILADKYKAPVFQFSYESRPRAAFPYLFILLLSVFHKLGHLELSEKEIVNISRSLSEMVQKCGSSVSAFQNPAKILAQKMHSKIPVVYCTEMLSGVGMRIKAAFNENSKNFSFMEEFPDLNHKSLEGLSNPKDFVYVLMLESNYEFERNQLRENITAEILTKTKVPLERIKFIKAESRLEEIFMGVLYGDFISYYLGILNRANPGINDAVDYLKERLA